MDRNEVSVASDIVLEEIESAIAALNKEGGQAFQQGKYEVAKELMERGSQMTAFREKVNELHKQWNTIFATVAPRKVRRRGRRIAERLKRGLRTPEDAFRVPILQAIVDLGGSALMTSVLHGEFGRSRKRVEGGSLRPSNRNDQALNITSTRASGSNSPMIATAIPSRSAPSPLRRPKTAGHAKTAEKVYKISANSASQR